MERKARLYRPPGVEDPNAPGLDEATIEWPSDHVTYGRIREIEHDRMDWDGANHLHARVSELDIVAANICERTVARAIFCKAMGWECVYEVVPRRDVLSELEPVYKKYGIASGSAQTEELLRRIEEAAIAQAIKQGGRDPRRGRGRGKG